MAIGDSYLQSEDYGTKPAIMYHFTIYLYTKKFGGKFVKKLRWEGYRLDWSVKWRWYFEYRAALLKVQYPRYFVECKWGPFTPEVVKDIKVVETNKLKKDITTAKRMRTKFKNAIQKYKDIQATILIPDWENPAYLKALAKFEFYSNKLEELQVKLKSYK